MASIAGQTCNKAILCELENKEITLATDSGIVGRGASGCYMRDNLSTYIQ